MFRVILSFSIFCVVLSGVGAVCKRLYAGMLPKQFILNCSNARFSGVMLERLRLFIKEQEKVSLNPEIFAAVAHDSFSAIEKLVIKSQPSGFMDVAIKSVIPKVRINNTMVLGHNNAVVEKDVFLEEDIKDLPQFFIHCPWQEAHYELYIPENYKRFINNFNGTFLNRYEVKWIDDKQIQLLDKSFPKVTMLINYETQLNKELEDAYVHARDKALHRKKTKAWKQGLCVDLRFKNQIIVFPGGARV